MKKSKQSKLSGNFRLSSIQKLIVLILVVITLLNNFRVSENTRNRENISTVWDVVTRSDSFFEEVKNKDLFISTTYNDAYEINVADFYQKTGIRLAAFVWPGYIWENFETCTNYVDCPLADATNRINNWLTNISKGESYLRIFMKKWEFKNDWPKILQSENALAKSQFWYFNIYMLTDQVGLAYLIPIIKNNSNINAELDNSKVLLVSLNTKTQIKPSINGYCMVPKDAIKTNRVGRSTAYSQTWQFPEVANQIEGVDLRYVATGTC